MTRIHLCLGWFAVLCLAGCGSSVAPSCSTLDDVSHHASSIALPARQALLGRVEGFDALQLQRARGEVLLHRLTQSNESGRSSWWGSSSDEPELYADLRQQWLTLRGHMDELLQARSEILALRGAMDAQSTQMPVILSRIDIIAHHALDLPTADAAQIYTIKRLTNLGWGIRMSRDEFFTAEHIGLDGGFFRCGHQTFLLNRSLLGFKHGNAEIGVARIDSDYVQYLLDELLPLVSQLDDHYETICASEMMIGKAQESFSALRQAASELQAMADSAALRCGG